MSAGFSLLAANIVVWCGIGLYVFFLARKAANLEHRLDQFEALRDDHD